MNKLFGVGLLSLALILSGCSSDNNTNTPPVVTPPATTTPPVVTTPALSAMNLTPSTLNHTAPAPVVVTGTYTGAIDHIGMSISALGLTIPMGNAAMDGKGTFTYTITPASLGAQGAAALQAGLITSAVVTATAYDGNNTSLSTQTQTLTVK